MTTTPPLDPSVDRASAFPVAATTWETHSVDAKIVQQALDYLWAEVRDPASGPADIEQVRSTDQITMRASTVNLVVLCDSVETARDISDVIGHLREFCPSRTVILVTDGPHHEEDQLTIRTAVYQRPVGRDRPPVIYETVTVMANSKRASSLANIASTLLIPELPDFLWWHSQSLLRHPLFDELTDICDRLIVDTTAVNRSLETIRMLARLAGVRQSEIHLSDLTWARLTPWRHLIAQFYDDAIALASIDRIDEVAISYGYDGDSENSRLASGLLLAGWLATRLGWHAPGELVRAGTGWRLTLRAGSRGQQREIVLRLQPEPGEFNAESLLRIDLRTSDDAPCVFSIERESQNGLITTGTVTDRAPVARLTFTRSLDLPSLLSDELRMFGRDVVFEDALIFAAKLLPDGGAD
ncbi:MAG: glucose-6-phosphate dehydrogenase assembly protein OpcA [Thermomicrobiales bacterium]